MMDLLNHCLEVGENYIPYIFDMLAKFRWNAVALTADIEKAFLMVGIKQEDRGVDKTWAMAHGLAHGPPYGLPIFLIGK